MFSLDGAGRAKLFFRRGNALLFLSSDDANVGLRLNFAQILSVDLSGVGRFDALGLTDRFTLSVDFVLFIAYGTNGVCGAGLRSGLSDSSALSDGRFATRGRGVLLRFDFADDFARSFDRLLNGAELRGGTRRAERSLEGHGDVRREIVLGRAGDARIIRRELRAHLARGRVVRFDVVKVQSAHGRALIRRLARVRRDGVILIAWRALHRRIAASRVASRIVASADVVAANRAWIAV